MARGFADGPHYDRVLTTVSEWSEMNASELPTNATFDLLVASLQDVATKTRWPTGGQGNAARLLAIDIAEHGWAIAASVAAHRFSPAFTLLRPLQERIFFIRAASIDSEFAARYLANEGASSDSSRPRNFVDEARGVLARAWGGDDRDARRSFHEPWTEIQTQLSDYTHGSTTKGIGATLALGGDPSGSGVSSSLIVIGNALFVANHQVVSAASTLAPPVPFNLRPALREWIRTLERLIASMSGEPEVWTDATLGETRRIAALFTEGQPRSSDSVGSQ